MLTSAPLFLHFPVDHKPLILTTDASGIGVGGVLQQKVDGQLRNLYYHSQLMTPCEKKYSTIEKEALAIYKCFARMRPFLLGRSIILMTDHCPLCNIMHKTVRNVRVDRIATLIQEYNIEQVIHIKGRENCLPDYLSRHPREQDDELYDIDYGIASKENFLQPEFPAEGAQVSLLRSNKPRLVAAMTLRSRKNKNQTVQVTTIPDNEDALNNNDFNSESDKDTPSTSPIPLNFSSNHFDVTKLKEEQQKDSHIQHIIQQLKENPGNPTFTCKDGLLYKLITPSRFSKTNVPVVYLSSFMIKPLLHACHDDPMIGGHFSTNRTYNKIRTHYWWPNMKHTIKKHIQSCLLCQQYNISRYKKHGHLRPIPPHDGPFMLVGIDYCGPFKRTPRENQYVLVITDYFTRHITAIALPDCSAQTTAQALFNDYFCKYGIPAVIISDQGPHFQNILMENIQK
ncbi:unnamed protein product [Didymodactylos carnosus]|uniref:Integrase catalytic domain-containing protein n=1 Tax=Didymodactylos carnosus TaxID=1234261 RepID=A0A815G1G7_9BILA|nr:unnamed protein product [Didymodactylos carnosus]CAF4187703.1 unnamed protein product [Didymodactylos carnosus]